jgi:hypothetical protein
MKSPRAEVDHLVVAARTLEEGVQWCEATLGVTPAAGGTHPRMGTHNRLLAISAAGFARCYLEIIANTPQHTGRGKGLHRWFDLDDANLQAVLAQRGPRLVHFVVRVPDARASVHAWAGGEHPIDRGHVIEAARDSAAGRLEWRISVRDDGQRLFYGALPTLIQWGAVHPTDSLEAAGPSGVGLVALAARHPRALALRSAFDAIGLSTIDLGSGPPNLVATLRTPRGLVTLESAGI